MKIDLPYLPLSGAMLNFGIGRCATGWMIEELVGHRQFMKHCLSAGNTTQPVSLLAFIAVQAPYVDLVNDINHIVCCNDAGAKNPVYFSTAFRMLPDLLEKHREYFESISSPVRVLSTIAKIQGIIDRSEPDGGELDAFRGRLCFKQSKLFSPAVPICQKKPPAFKTLRKLALSRVSRALSSHQQQ